MRHVIHVKDLCHVRSVSCHASCLTCQKGMSHFIHVNESTQARWCRRFMPRIVTCVACVLCVLCRIASHVTHVKKTQVMSYMSHMLKRHESCHTCKWVMASSVMPKVCQLCCPYICVYRYVAQTLGITVVMPKVYAEGLCHVRSVSCHASCHTCYGDMRHVIHVKDLCHVRNVSYHESCHTC